MARWRSERGGEGEEGESVREKEREKSPAERKQIETKFFLVRTFLPIKTFLLS